MSVAASADQAIAGGNHYPKYTARNPIAHRLVNGFLAALADLAARSGAGRAHEIGCGEGFLSTMLARRGLPCAAATSVRPRWRSRGAAPPSWGCP